MAIDAATEAIIREDEELSRRFDIVLSIPGIGSVAAFALLIDMHKSTSVGRQNLACLNPARRFTC